MAQRVGFVGTGFISKIHAAAARQVGADLTAVVNHRPETRAVFAEAFGIPHQFESLDELLAAGGVDALVISTPNALHAEQAIAALNAGVAVLVEKPMAMSAAECERMVDASDRSGAPLMVAHCWRFDDEVIWLREHAGAIGSIVRTKGYGVHVQWGPTGWFTQRALAGGGALADMGVHAIDTVRCLLGDPKPVSVYARIGTHYGAYDVDDTGLIVINWEGGALSTIECGWWQPHSDGVAAATQLYGAHGWASLFPTGLWTGPTPAGPLNAADPGFAFPRVEHVPQALYERQMAHFLECARTRATPVPGGREGWVNLKIIDAAYASARTGQVVAIG
jgi:predicted dehydrogenase